MKSFIIAEAGVNHNGSLDLARKLVDVAAEAGADAVKFQTFKAEAVISKRAPKAAYQITQTGSNESQLDMVKRLELSENDYRALAEHCRSRKIEFLSTPFDLDSVDFLTNVLKVRLLKLPSGEVTNAPYLLKTARTGLPLIMSTGMCTLAEIEAALGVLAFGMLEPNANPKTGSFQEAFSSEQGQRLLRERVSLLHCTTEYPAPFEDVNLRAMEVMSKKFNLPIGFSDHTTGISAPIAARALGASIIEKHFTTDRELPGPDHKASLEPDELIAMVRSIREVELALGESIKQPSKSELKNIAIARKSLVALQPIRQGEPFTEQNLGIKRPGNGVSPFEYWSRLGQTATRSLEEDELIP